MLNPCGCIKIYSVVPSTPTCPDCLAASVAFLLCKDSIDAGDPYTVDVSEYNTYPSSTCSARTYTILRANELWNLTISVGASTGGDITINLDGEAFAITLVGTESTTEVADAIVAQFVDPNGNWSVYSNAAEVYFTRSNTDASTSSPSLVDTDTTSAAGSFAAIDWSSGASFTGDELTATIHANSQSGKDYIIDYRVSCDGSIYSAIGTFGVCVS